MNPNTHTTSQERASVVRLLDRALATELVCMSRRQRHYRAARGVYGHAAEDKLRERAEADAWHADAMAQRLVALGGIPDCRLETLAARSFVAWDVAVQEDEDIEDVFLPDLVDEDLIAEQIAIDAYREIADDIRAYDPVTARLLNSVAAAEEGHSSRLAHLLESSQALDASN